MDKNQLFRKSKYLVSVKRDSGYIIWHSLLGNPLVISDQTLDFIDLFNHGLNLDKTIKKYRLKKQGKIIEALISNYYLVPLEFDDRAVLQAINAERQKKIISGKMIKSLSLIMSDTCNFRCSYCIHYSNLYSSGRLNSRQKFMSFAVAQKAVDIYFDMMILNGKSSVYINFGGGEPLLNWSTIQSVLTYCEQKYSSKFDITFSLNTNASLLNEEIALWLKRNKVQIATSFDGLAVSNNAVRKTKRGGATDKIIWKGIRALKNVGYPIDGFSATINDTNFPMLDEGLLNFVAENQMSELRLDIDVIGIVAVPVEEIVNRIKYLMYYASKRGISMTGFWARPSENLSCSTDDEVAFCGANRGNNLCINPQGNIYPCGYSTTYLGRIDEMKKFFQPDGAYCQYAISHLPGYNESCRDCILEGQCIGGCSITREYAFKHQTLKVERMCDFYRQMTLALI